MHTQQRLHRRLLSALLAALLLFSFLVLLAFGSHECMDADCAVCALVDTVRNLLGTLLPLAFIGVMAESCRSFRKSGQRILFSAERSPIALKVKLSN